MLVGWKCGGHVLVGWECGGQVLAGRDCGGVVGEDQEEKTHTLTNANKVVRYNGKGGSKERRSMMLSVVLNEH